MPQPTNLSGLAKLVAAKKAEQQSKQPEPKKNTVSFKGLAEIIARQQNAKVSAGDKEIAAEKKQETLKLGTTGQAHTTQFLNDQIKQQADASTIAKQIMNARPEIIIQKAENAMQYERVNAPVVSLRALVAANKVAEQQKQSELVDDKHAPALDAHGKPILEFDPDQEAAVNGLLANQYGCVIGKAGTGKTTTLNKFVASIEQQIETIKYDVKDEDGTYRTKYKLSIVFCAFTGRAVEQMKKRIPAKYHGVCGTIHGDVVLTYIPEFYDDIDAATGMLRTKVRFVPSYDETRKLPYTIYVIDESGMLSVDLWNTLRKAMRPDARVYLVGDINQLPPVYGRSILGYAMTKWPTFELNTIHRQARNNPIIANAHRILEGNVPVAAKGKFDMESVGDRGSLETQTRVVNIIKHLHKNGSFNELRDGFIVPQNVGNIGQHQFNELLVPYFNPEKSIENKRYLIKTGISMVHFAKGDKIMLLANDKQNNLTNGQIGLVTSVNMNGAYSNSKGGVTHADLSALHGTEVDEEDFALEIEQAPQTEAETKEKEGELNQRQASHIVTARFGDIDVEELASYEQAKRDYDVAINDNKKEYSYEEIAALREKKDEFERRVNLTSREVSFSTAGEFRLIAHAYAFTCHKSQGGEYPTVVILLHSANAVLLSREWLYTAVTRAQQRVILIYNDRGIMLALKNQRIKGRNLKEKIQSFIEAAEKDAKKGDDAIVPNLPMPMRIIQA